MPMTQSPATQKNVSFLTDQDGWNTVDLDALQANPPITLNAHAELARLIELARVRSSRMRKTIELLSVMEAPHVVVHHHQVTELLHPTAVELDSILDAIVSHPDLQAADSE